MASLRWQGGKAKNVEDYGMAVARTVQPLVWHSYSEGVRE
jgi:hypothetical protein